MENHYKDIEAYGQGREDVTREVLLAVRKIEFKAIMLADEAIFKGNEVAEEKAELLREAARQIREALI